jgi:predicted N-acyltransferase
MCVRDQRIRVHDSIAEIGRAAWEEISARDEWEWSYDYLSFVEASRPMRPRYVASYARSGRLLGAFHARLTSEEVTSRSMVHNLHMSRWLLRSDDPAALDEERSLVREVVGDDPGPDPIAALRAWLDERCNPCLSVSSLCTTAAVLAPSLDAAERTGVLEALVDHILASIGRDWRSVLFAYVPRDDAELRPLLLARGLVGARFCAEASIDGLQALTGLDDYWACFGRNRRWGLRKEARSIARQGLTVRPIDLREHGDRVAELMACTRRKHGEAVSGAEIATTNALLATHLGDRLRVVGCFEQELLIAVAMGVVEPRSYTSLFWGADYASMTSKGVYAFMGIYEPLQHAIDIGADRLRFLIESYQAKCMRGAKLAPREFHLMADPVVNDRIRPWFELVDRRNAALFAELEARFPPIACTGQIARTT